MLSFAEVLDPLPMQAFLSSVMGSRHHLTPDSSRRFEALMSWTELSQILLTHRLDYPQLRLVRQGVTIPTNRYLIQESGRRGVSIVRPDPPRIEALMKSGAMLHLAAADELSVGLQALAKSVEEAVGSRCFINLHAGLHASRGFDTHWDGHEVCVLQVSGRKRWRVHGETVKSPLAVSPDEKGSPPSALLWEGMLEQGSVLYMPRGWWHSAEATDGPSLHLSLGWENPTGADFLRWVVERTRNDPVMRSDTPYASTESLPFLSALRSHLGNESSSSAYAAFLSERQAAALARREGITLP